MDSTDEGETPSHNSKSTQTQQDSQKYNAILKKIVWSVIAVGVCVGFVLHLMTLIERYSTFPVNTEFEEKANSYKFPDVTLCPTMFGSKTYGEKFIPSDTAPIIRVRGVKDIMFDSARIIHMLKIGNKNVSVPQRPFASYRDGKFALRKIAYRTKQFPEAHDIVIYCRFNSEKCNFKNFTNQNDEEHFKCITFTPLNRTVTDANRGGGLQIMFLIHNNAVLTDEEEIQFIPGLQVILHEPGQKPNQLAQSIVAPHKYYSEVVIETSIDEKINRDTYKCLESLPNVTYVTDFSQINQSIKTQNFTGSVHDCAIRIMQNQYLSECSCLATHLPLPADLYDISDGVCHNLHEDFMFRRLTKVISPNNFTYYIIANNSDVLIPVVDYLNDNWHLYNTSWSKIDCYHKVLQRHKKNGVNTESCPIPCKQTKYKMNSRKTNWPRVENKAHAAFAEFFNEALNEAAVENLTLDDLNWLKSESASKIFEIMGVLDLHPRELAIKRSKEDWAYPLRNFFSDFGGILGLWIGASIVSLAELLESAIIAVILFCKTRVANKIPTPRVIPSDANAENCCDDDQAWDENFDEKK